MQEEFETLEELQEALDAEQSLWDELGLNMGGLQIGNPAPVIVDIQAKLQAIVNVLVQKDLVEEEELNFAYKLIILNNMRALREQAPAIQKENLRRQILDGINMRLNGDIKPPWEK
jgi:hypothetical protein